MLIARNVVPRGFPSRRRVLSVPLSLDRDVLRRNSCVMAIPIDAKASDVRSQARNVRSTALSAEKRGQQPEEAGKHSQTNRAPDDLSPRCPCFPTRPTERISAASATNSQPLLAD